MIILWGANEVPGAGGVRKLFSLQGWATMKVQVKDASTFYFAQDKQALLNTVNGVQGGLSVTKADGIKEFWVTGDVYAFVSNPAAQVDIEIFEQGMQVTPQ